MSKRINVNPDHYKTAGRARQDDAARERMKQRPPAKPSEPSRGVRERTKPIVSVAGAKRKSRSPVRPLIRQPR